MKLFIPLLSILYPIYADFVSIIDNLKIGNQVTPDICTIAAFSLGDWAFAAQQKCELASLSGTQTLWNKIEPITEDGIDYFKLQLTEVYNFESTNPSTEVRCMTTTMEDNRMGVDKCNLKTRQFYLDNWNRIVIRQTANEIKRSKPIKCVYIEEDVELYSKVQIIRQKRCGERLFFNEARNQLTTAHTGRKVLFQNEKKKKVIVDESSFEVDEPGYPHMWEYTSDKRLKWANAPEDDVDYCLNQRVMRNGKVKNKLTVVACDKATQFHIDDASETGLTDNDMEIHPINEDGKILYHQCMMTVERNSGTKLLISPCRRDLGLWTTHSFYENPNV